MHYGWLQAKGGEQVKKGYVGIHSSGFNDFLLKPELSQVRFLALLCLCSLYRLQVLCMVFSERQPSTTATKPYCSPGCTGHQGLRL